MSSRVRGVVTRGVAVWLVMIGAEFVNGAFRAILITPRVGDFRARQMGVFTGSALILCIACVFSRWIGASGKRELFRVGVLWLALTTAFELGFGHFVFGRTWQDLGADYDLAHGGLLPFGLLVLLLSPMIAAHVRGGLSH